MGHLAPGNDDRASGIERREFRRQVIARMESRTATTVVHRPHVFGGMQAGIHKLAGVLRPTLGPQARVTASASINPNGVPELLESGGIIARRMFQLPDAEQNIGAMLLRDMLTRVYDLGGDGVATASVVFESVFDEGIREITAGVDPTRLRSFLRQGLVTILEELDRQRLDIQEGQRLRQVARTVCAELDLADEIGELFALLGAHGNVEVRKGQNDMLQSTLIDGAYWDGTVHHPLMLIDQVGRRADVELCTVFVSDLDIVEPADMVRVLEVARQLPVSGLMLIARQISPSATSVLMANSTASFRIYGVRVAGESVAHQTSALIDLAIVTGARLFRSAAGDTVISLHASDFGHARRAWITRTQFGLIAPAGNGQVVRQHVGSLRQRCIAASDEEQKAVGRRIARLTSSSAIIWVDGANIDAIDRRKELAERTVKAVRGALSQGALPGAGAALLACRVPLTRLLTSSRDPDQQAACRVLLRSLESPARVLAANSGIEAAVVLDRAERAGRGFALNVVTGVVEDVCQAGILDSFGSMCIAVQSAVSAAAQALTIDTLVMRGSMTATQRKRSENA